MLGEDADLGPVLTAPRVAGAAAHRDRVDPVEEEDHLDVRERVEGGGGRRLDHLRVELDAGLLGIPPVVDDLGPRAAHDADRHHLEARHGADLGPSLGRFGAMSTTFEIAGDLKVHRLGFGAMRLTGDGIWGPPADRDECLRGARGAVELGVDFIDTADSLRPDRLRGADRRGAGALRGRQGRHQGRPTRTGPGEWHPVGRPEYLKQQLELSLRRLQVDSSTCGSCTASTRRCPARSSSACSRSCSDEGKVRHVGLSEVSVEEIEAARKIVPIATVQNLYNLADRQREDVLEHCEANGHRVHPVVPPRRRQARPRGGPLAEATKRHGGRRGGRARPGCSTAHR